MTYPTVVDRICEYIDRLVGRFDVRSLLDHDRQRIAALIAEHDAGRAKNQTQALSETGDFADNLCDYINESLNFEFLCPATEAHVARMIAEHDAAKDAEIERLKAEGESLVALSVKRVYDVERMRAERTAWHDAFNIIAPMATMAGCTEEVAVIRQAAEAAKGEKK